MIRQALNDELYPPNVCSNWCEYSNRLHMDLILYCGNDKIAVYHTETQWQINALYKITQQISHATQNNTHNSKIVMSILQHSYTFCV